MRRDHARVRRHVAGAELRQLVRLRVEPAERLEAGESLVRGQRARRQRDGLVRAELRREDKDAHLLDLRVVGRRAAVHVRRDLRGARAVILRHARGLESQHSLPLPRTHTWVRRSDTQMNLRRRFFGRTYVRPVSLSSSDET